MAISKDKLKETVKLPQNVIKSYGSVDAAADVTKETFSAVKQTAVGAKTSDTVGGIKSLTSKIDVLGAINLDPTEGLVTSEAAPEMINNALNTNTSALNISPGVSIDISYSDSGYVNGIIKTPGPATDISTIISKMTGLGAAPGFLQNMISAANAKGITKSLGSLPGKIGAFSSPSAVNAISSRTQAVVDQMVSTAITDGSATSLLSLDAVAAEGAKAIADVASMMNNGGTVSNLSKTLNLVSGATNPKNLFESVRDYSNTRAGVVNKTNQFQSDVDRIFPKSDLGFAQDLVQKVDPNSVANIFRNAGVDVPPKEQKRIAALAQGTPSERVEALSILRKSTGKSTKQIEKFLLDLDTTVAGTVIVDTSNSVFADPFRVGQDNSRWNNGVGAEDYIFSFISSVEELEAEFKNVSREITEMVIHWSDTYTNANIGSEEINRAFVGLGYNGIGYHYVIRRDGSVQRGRPSGIEGQHAQINGHNARSLAVVFVGGLNCASGTPNPIEYRSSASLTRSQMSSFQEICRSFYLAFPGGQILGHNDLDINEEDPGFDVRDYVDDVFGKKSLFSNTFNQPPLTSAEINNTRIT